MPSLPSDTATITVFTWKGVRTILETGGSQAWTVSRANAARSKYLVCCRNRRDARVEGPEEHGSAFMIGRVTDVVLVPERSTDPRKTKRYKVAIDAWAPLHIPAVWQGWRLPFHYTTLEDLCIDLREISWRSLNEIPAELSQTAHRAYGEPDRAGPSTLSAPAFDLAAAVRDAVDAGRHVIMHRLNLPREAVRISLDYSAV